MKRWTYLSLILGSFVILAGSLVTSAADVYMGAFMHPWLGYPSDSLNLDIRPTYTTGPTLSFSAGILSCTLWYGIDPNRTGYLCVQDAFGVPAGDMLSLGAITDEVGWRISSTGPAFLSASVSRLRWIATALCNEEIGSSLVSMQIGAGGGVRIGSLWACAEYGIHWTKATPDFTDVDSSPTGNVIVSFGYQTRLNPIPATALRHPVASFPIGFEESFPIGCDQWDWEGQAGYVRVIDEQLGILIEREGETIVRTFDSEFSRCAIDMDIIPRSSGSENHSCGVVVRYQDPANYYCVEIRTDGFVRLCQMIDGIYEPRSRWRQTGSLRQGERNAVRVLVPGNRVVAYLNGRKVLDEEEVSFTEGQVGVFVRSYGEAGAWVTFDDLTIRRLDRNIVLDPRSEEAKDVERFERAALALLAGVAAYISNREGLAPVSYGFAAVSLYEILYPSRHLLEVR